MEICQKCIGTNWNSSQKPKLEEFEQKNKEAVHYNSMYKINILESILIEINDWIDR